MQLGVNVPNFGPGTGPGLLRQWAQTVEGLGFEGRPQLVARLRGSGGGKSLLLNGHIDVVPARREDGWEQGTYGTAAIVEFTREGSFADIHISSKAAKEGAPAELQVEVSGPCVMTDGEGSDEVTKLEVQSN